MNDNGYVYVLMNPSMGNLVKIGKSTRNPQDRAKELSASTGVATPFVVVYDYYFESCSEAEQYVHTNLENNGYRVSKRREFFEIPIKDAIDAVMKASNHFGEFTPSQANIVDEEGVFNSDGEDDLLKDLDYEEKIAEPWEEMFEIAETHYYGHGDEIVDYDEAMHYYLQAIKLGSVESYCKIGSMYTQGSGVRIDNNKAFQYFKEGAKKGDINCYAEMAQLFEEQDKIDNALKCWKKYFELTSSEINYLQGNAYISFVFNNKLPLNYIDQLLVVKKEIYDFQLYCIDLAYQNGSDFIIPGYKKVLKYIESNVVDQSQKFKDQESSVVDQPEKFKNFVSTKPKSFWKKIF